MVVMLVNIFLAIVLDAYSDVKNELQGANVPSLYRSSPVKLRSAGGAWHRVRQIGGCRSAQHRGGDSQTSHIELTEMSDADPQPRTMASSPVGLSLMDSGGVGQKEHTGVSWVQLDQAMRDFEEDTVVTAAMLQRALRVESLLLAQRVLKKVQRAAGVDRPYMGSTIADDSVNIVCSGRVGDAIGAADGLVGAAAHCSVPPLHI